MVRVAHTGSFATDTRNSVPGHPLQDRSQAVSTVSDAVDTCLPTASPRGIVLVHVLEFVQVFTLCVVGCAEEPLAHEFAHNHVGLHVGIVLGHHVHTILPFADFYQPAAFLDRDTGGDLTKHMQPTLQRRNAVRNVQMHGSADDHGIQFRRTQHVFIVLVLLRSFETCRGGRQGFGVHVTHGMNPDSCDGIASSLEARAPSACRVFAASLKLCRTRWGAGGEKRPATRLAIDLPVHTVRLIRQLPLGALIGACNGLHRLT